MADSADLVVLGAWYGTGNKGPYHPRHFIRLTQKVYRACQVNLLEAQNLAIALINRDKSRRCFRHTFFVKRKFFSASFLLCSISISSCFQIFLRLLDVHVLFF